VQVHTLQIKLNGSLRGTTESLPVGELLEQRDKTRSSIRGTSGKIESIVNPSLPVGELLEQRENIYVGSIKGTHEKIGKGNPPTPKSYVIEGIETELIE